MFIWLTLPHIPSHAHLHQIKKKKKKSRTPKAHLNLKTDHTLSPFECIFLAFLNKSVCASIRHIQKFYFCNFCQGPHSFWVEVLLSRTSLSSLWWQNYRCTPLCSAFLSHFNVSPKPNYLNMSKGGGGMKGIHLTNEQGNNEASTTLPHC